MLLQEIHAIICEAKSVRDFRHTDISDQFKFFGNSTIDYITPSEGFHFLYREGELILSSTSNDTYSGVVAKNLWKKTLELWKNGKGFGLPREILTALRSPNQTNLWNSLSGKVVFSDKIITFAKEDVAGKLRVRAVNDVKDFQAALKNLIHYGVTKDFKIRGLSTPYNGMTVERALAEKNPVDELATKSSGQIMFHGTSLSRWEEFIKTQGLRPGNTGDSYVDLIPGYSDHNIYLATNAKTAEFYGKRQAKKDASSEYVILKIEVPDASKILPDDGYAHNIDKHNTYDRNKLSIKELGSVAYKGIIRPAFITLLSKKKA